jgi:DNA-binding beta-propeller fold protein YncE
MITILNDNLFPHSWRGEHHRHPPTLGGTRQLQGMALTPDDSKLVVGNFSDDSVSVIDPDNPTTAKAVQIAPPIGPDSL